MIDKTTSGPETVTVGTASTRKSQWSSVTFSARDLLNVAIFAVIYFVIVFAIAMLGIISPVLMLITLPLAVIAAGIPYLLFLTRVKHAGMVTLFAVVLGAVFTVTGYPAVAVATVIGLSLVVEVILWVTRYRSRWAGVASYAVFAAWYATPLLPLFYAREEYFSSPSMARMGPEYTAGLDAFLSPGVLIAFDVATVVLGLVGGVIALGLLRKHFTRAGLA